MGAAAFAGSFAQSADSGLAGQVLHRMRSLHVLFSAAFGQPNCPNVLKIFNRQEICATLCNSVLDKHNTDVFQEEPGKSSALSCWVPSCTALMAPLALSERPEDTAAVAAPDSGRIKLQGVELLLAKAEAGRT